MHITRSFLACYSCSCYSYMIGDIILNRSNNSVFLRLNSASLSSHLRLKSLNETRGASSSGLLLKILKSIFKSINLGVDNKLRLQLFLSSFWLFCNKIGKKISRKISFNLRLLLGLSARFSYTSRQSSANSR